MFIPKKGEGVNSRFNNINGIQFAEFLNPNGATGFTSGRGTIIKQETEKATYAKIRNSIFVFLIFKPKSLLQSVHSKC